MIGPKCACCKNQIKRSFTSFFQWHLRPKKRGLFWGPYWSVSHQINEMSWLPSPVLDTVGAPLLKWWMSITLPSYSFYLRPIKLYFVRTPPFWKGIRLIRFYLRSNFSSSWNARRVSQNPQSVSLSNPQKSCCRHSRKAVAGTFLSLTAEGTPRTLCEYPRDLAFHLQEDLLWVLPEKNIFRNSPWLSPETHVYPKTRSGTPEEALMSRGDHLRAHFASPLLVTRKPISGTTLEVCCSHPSVYTCCKSARDAYSEPPGHPQSTFVRYTRFSGSALPARGLDFWGGSSAHFITLDVVRTPIFLVKTLPATVYYKKEH